jgi:uncharacterized protein YgiM (DUF1202 family)
MALIAASWVTSVLATADGPDFFAVTDVAADDVLNLRAGPSAQAKKIGQIPYDARRLRNLGCQALPSIGEWERMTEQQRRKSRKHYWCKVGYQGVEGWVAGRFLREDSGAPGPVSAGPPLSDFRMSCRESAAYQVGVSDEGDIRQEDTSVRETLPLAVDVKVQDGTDTIRMVTVIEQVGDLRREMDGTLEVETAVNADRGHWLLDLQKNLLRRVEPVAGRSARFAVFACERR